VNYANGPVNVDALYQSRVSAVAANAGITPPYKQPGTSKSINEWYVGGSWDFKVVKAFASYQALDNKNNVGAAADVSHTDLASNLAVSNIKSNNLWTVGLTAPIGRGTLGIGYGRLSLNNRNMQDGDSWGRGARCTPIRSPSGPPFTLPTATSAMTNTPSRVVPSPSQGMAWVHWAKATTHLAQAFATASDQTFCSPRKRAPWRPFSCS
jgi:predicted porin